MNLKEIRKIFLEFFKSKDHKIVKSAPIVVKNDPSLMFTNAGMNQFKDYFLGEKSPENLKVTDTQKCLRVSGKHNDLEEVGKDTYHHTMFEMLGNWSFGDYFKKEAIAWAWELLTEKYNLSKDRLYVTVFGGDKDEGLEKDQETKDYWKDFVDESRILECSKKDNFWEMGDTGPCGPCSEIHIDLRDEADRQKVAGVDLVNKDHPKVVELWNLVFIQYNRKSSGELENLPERHVDTGMGLERLAMVVQGKQSNYDIDVFQSLIAEIETLSGFRYGQDPSPDVAFRVIADHVRAVTFAIADGQLPSNTGPGYVIRRILRRGVRYGYTFLDLKSPFMSTLVSKMTELFGEDFPEIKEQESLIYKVIKEEEHSFLRTLESGLKRMDQLMQAANEKVIPGTEAFELYDTYGFPLDLTSLIADEKGFTVDEVTFETEMQKQKDRSKADAEKETGDWIIVDDGETQFIGYEHLEAEVKILKYRKVLHKENELYQVVLDKTPFYAEMGGQVGDTGRIVFNDKSYNILNTIKDNRGRFLHELLALMLPWGVDRGPVILIGRQE